MTSRPVSVLNISPSLREKLINYGFENTAELVQLGVVGLSRLLKIPTKDSAEIVGAASVLPVTSKGVSALDMLELEQHQKYLSIGCDAIDGLFKAFNASGSVGGLLCGQITEICGAPGTGKSQIAMQCAVRVQLPETRGGLNADALYIDTEGSLFPDRVADMARACFPENEIETCLKRIHYYRVHDYLEQIAITHLLPDILKQYPTIKLVVIDSIALHFRHSFKDMSLRTRLLNSMALMLAREAKVHGLVVLIVNQMTTKFTKTIQNQESVSNKYQIPALGSGWAHLANNRLLTEQVGSTRQISLIKSANFPHKSVNFTIKLEGVQC